MAITTAPYALRGPWFGAGVVAYAHRWEHGAVLFAGVRGFFELGRCRAAPDARDRLGAGAMGTADRPALWDALYRMVWPQELARVDRRRRGALAGPSRSRSGRGLDAAHEARLALGGALLLAPTLHPGTCSGCCRSPPPRRPGEWLLFGALVPLQYLAGGGDVPWAIRARDPPAVARVDDPRRAATIPPMNTDPLGALIARAKTAPLAHRASRGRDPRTLAAARGCNATEIARPILVGSKAAIAAAAREASIDIAGIAIEDPAASAHVALVAHAIAEAIRGTTTTPDEAARVDVRSGVTSRTRWCAQGSRKAASPAPRTRRRRRCAPRSRSCARRRASPIVSSFFSMALREPTAAGDDLLAFADCGLVPDPDAGRARRDRACAPRRASAR